MDKSSKANERIAQMKFSSIYPLYVSKIEKKGRTKDELHQVIKWLTEFDEDTLQTFIDSEVTFKEFFNKAQLNKHADLITGTICGIKIEEIEDKLTKKVRYLDKLIDELSKGKSLDKILRKK